MAIPTELVGSLPRPMKLQEAYEAYDQGKVTWEELQAEQDAAAEDSIRRLEATGEPIVTDGEQRESSFATYPITDTLAGTGLADNLAGDGQFFAIFDDGHHRQLPRLTGGPFRYKTFASEFVEKNRAIAGKPVKQAVIAPSALSLLYPADGIPGYPREAFLEDLKREAESDIRRALDAGAYNVQLDFTEGRLAAKLDPSLGLLRAFIAINNEVLGRFSDSERQRLGVHTCPGGDRDSTHSADVDYAQLLPDLFQLQVGNFYVQLASERERPRVLGLIKPLLKPSQRVFVGVTDPIDPEVETPYTVRDRVLEAARVIPVDRLGTTDDCGFSPFADDTSTARQTAFDKIFARVEGTALAGRHLGL